MSTPLKREFEPRLLAVLQQVVRKLMVDFSGLPAHRWWVEDAVFDVVVELLNKQDPEQIYDLSAYLRKAARRRVLYYIGKMVGRLPNEIVAEEDGPAELAEQADIRAWLRTQIETLPKIKRKAMEAHLEGKSQKKIASELNLSEARISQIISSARTLLTRRLRHGGQ